MKEILITVSMMFAGVFVFVAFIRFTFWCFDFFFLGSGAHP